MNGPLAGWRVAVTRAEGQGDALAALLRAAGAEPLDYPTIAVAPPEDLSALGAAVERLLAGNYGWLALTSANAVRSLAQTLAHRRIPPVVVVAAVGPATAEACRELLGLEPSVVPDTFVAEALAAALGDLHGQQVLLLNSAIARPTLAALLRQQGADVDRAVAYRTITATSGGVDLPTLLANRQVHALTFTSGSTVRSFLERVGPQAIHLAQSTLVACIGPVTAEVAREVGLNPAVVAQDSTAEGLVTALIAYRG